MRRSISLPLLFADARRGLVYAAFGLRPSLRVAVAVPALFLARGLLDVELLHGDALGLEPRT